MLITEIRFLRTKVSAITFFAQGSDYLFPRCVLGRSAMRGGTGRLMWYPQACSASSFPFSPAAVETRQLADQLLIELEQLAAEHRERDAREGFSTGTWVPRPMASARLQTPTIRCFTSNGSRKEMSSMENSRPSGSIEWPLRSSGSLDSHLACAVNETSRE